jgi:hypothetical protein
MLFKHNPVNIKWVKRNIQMKVEKGKLLYRECKKKMESVVPEGKYEKIKIRM